MKISTISIAIGSLTNKYIRKLLSPAVEVISYHLFCFFHLTFKMAKIILAINAGSSSVKISIYRADQGQEPIELAETQIDGLTSPPPKLKYTRAGKTICKDKTVDTNISSQKEAVEFLLDELINDEDLKEITKKEDIHIACHRVVCSPRHNPKKLKLCN